MTGSLIFRAGNKAFVRIRKEGLSENMVNVIAGAAGGPKYLVLTGLDRFIFSSWLTSRKKPLFLLGSSIGAWRFAAASQNNPLEALKCFETHYIRQRYSDRPSALDITCKSREILDSFLTAEAVRDVLKHPYLRLSILAVRSKWPLTSDNKLLLLPGIAVSALGNLLCRRFLGFFFERVLFYDPRDLPPFFDISDFPTRKVPLAPENFKAVVMASGSIPIVMQSVKIPGDSEGVYRDGGIIDYHIDIPYLQEKSREKIILYPHYGKKIIPGWFDKKLIWRKPLNMENVLLLHPSDNFISKLPYGKIPERNDFYLFKGKDRERITYWRNVVDRSRFLAEDFIETIERGNIADLVAPLD
ncbi:MAG: hypothetical protein M0P57_12045 [Syntrophales bacterium]|jgi:hypothetical protein|nr:hypothetical protein [Syntrophales bacterium]MDY0044609.1 hypothetical protein [Syntrophales bacterium]